MSGEQPWIHDVLERWEGPLLRYTRSITGDLETARDVVQDAFLRLCAQPRERVEARVAEWLFTVCRHRALDLRRKEGRMTELPPATLAAAASAEPAPTAVAEGRDLLALVDGLPPGQAEVVRLRFQEGLSYKEIAAVTGHSVGNVGFLLHTALKGLRARAQATEQVEGCAP
ncbi:MAG: sigma-70 family RNA polymerase sigma factor [Planctomycetes bacterium]|nr:sigma-70 family RNA polymerase sigma factor [Planctomycetota bacterium]